MKTFHWLKACLCLILLVTGCAHERRLTDAKHPEIEVTESGDVLFRKQFVDPEDLPDLLDDCGFSKDDTINIRIPADLKNYRTARIVMGVLSQNGYRRPILIGERKAYSEVNKPSSAAPAARSRMRTAQPETPQQRAVRYK